MFEGDLEGNNILSNEDTQTIQRNQAFTGMVFDPLMPYYDSFIDKSRYAAMIGKPMYLFINGKEKYPVKRLRCILELPWRRIWILPGPDKVTQDQENEIAKDVTFFYRVKRA